MLPVQFLLCNPSSHPPVLSIIFGFGPLLLFPFLCFSFTFLVNNDALPTSSILFSDFRSCSRSKKPKSVHLHRHPRDACVGPAPAAPATPSPISTALEHSLCLGEICGQNHLLPRQEHFHQIVTNINTKDCKKKQTKNQKKTTTKQTKVKGCQERRLCSLQSAKPVAAQISALWATKSRTWVFPFTHVHALTSAAPSKRCAASREGGQGELELVYDIPEGLPGTRENMLREASPLPEVVRNAIIFFFPPFNYIPQSKEKSRLRKRLN